MNSLINGIVRALVDFVANMSSSNSASSTGASTSQEPSATRQEPRQEQRKESRPESHSNTRTPKPNPRPQPHGKAHQYDDPATSNRPHTSIREASIADALAHASYQPIMDGDADPGEVVWTWVPYQEDASVGKDRPAVVIGAQG